MKKTFTKIVVIAMFTLALSPALALAQGVQPFGPGGSGEVDNALGLGNQDPRTTAASVINVLMGFLGIIAVVIILLGGFKWMTAGGGEDKIAEAKKLMTAGVVGLAIILAAWGITVFVLNALLSATGATSTI
jgi:hypothetical protein